MTSPAAASKNKYGDRIYMVPKPGTLELVELPSVTGLLDVVAKPGLEYWKRWKLAQALALRPDLVALAGSGDLLPNGVRTGAKDAVKQAEEADRSASNRGTGVHYWVEQVDNGTIMWEMVPEPIKAAVAAYAQAKEDHGWIVLRNEYTVYSHTIGYSGTADQLTIFPKFDSAPMVADNKTSRDVHSDYALQCKAYAMADGIWVAPESTPLADSAMAQLEKDIQLGVNIPPTASGKKRSSWNQAAIKAAEAEIREAYWEEYATLGRHEDLPADLNQEFAMIIHIGDTFCNVVPLRIGHLEGAVRGLPALHAFLNDKLIVGDPIDPNPSMTVATPEQISAPPEEGAQTPPTAQDPPNSADESQPAAELPPPGQSGGLTPLSDQVDHLLVNPQDFPSLANRIDLAAARKILAVAEDNGTAIPEPSEEDLKAIAGGPFDDAFSDFQPEPPKSIPVSAPADNAKRIEVYRERIAALPIAAKQDLAFNWPAGVPTFKQSTSHTAEELDKIDTVLWKVESEHTPAAAEQRGAENLMAAFAGTKSL